MEQWPRPRPAAAAPHRLPFLGPGRSRPPPQQAARRGRAQPRWTSGLSTSMPPCSVCKAGTGPASHEGLCGAGAPCTEHLAEALAHRRCSTQGQLAFLPLRYGSALAQPNSSSKFKTHFLSHIYFVTGNPPAIQNSKGTKGHSEKGLLPPRPRATSFSRVLLALSTRM